MLHGLENVKRTCPHKVESSKLDDISVQGELSFKVKRKQSNIASVCQQEMIHLLYLGDEYI